MFQKYFGVIHSMNYCRFLWKRQYKVMTEKDLPVIDWCNCVWLLLLLTTKSGWVQDM